METQNQMTSSKSKIASSYNLNETFFGDKEKVFKKEDSMSKLIAKLILSISYAIFQAILFTAWLIVGVMFASNNYPPFLSMKDTVVIFWRVVIIIVTVYFSIVNYRGLTR